MQMSSEKLSTQELLRMAREHLGMETAWIAEIDGEWQTFKHVDSVKNGPEEGSQSRLDGSYCTRVLDGRLPSVVEDAKERRETRDLQITHQMDIQTYVGIPVRRPDGEAVGMLCCTSSEHVPVKEEAVAALSLLADMLGTIGEDEALLRREQQQSRERVEAVLSGSGLEILLQPIVDMKSGEAIAAEALARFSLEPFKPDLWFEEAERVGLRQRLEIRAAALALEHVKNGRAPAVSVNLSPDTLLQEELHSLLRRVDRTRLIIEVTEHAPVEDYELLQEALREHREAGARLAVDDAGAGYASFRHILALNPDLVKIDISLVRDVDTDPVKEALVASLLAFGRKSGTRIIAEGVETQGELDALSRLGVRLGQGYLLGKAVTIPAMDGYPQPSRGSEKKQSDETLAVLARAAERGDDALVESVLEVTLRLTGVQTCYLTQTRGTTATITHSRNAGSQEVPAGETTQWDEPSAEPVADHMQSTGLTTYLSVPVLGRDGTLLGTLCGAGTTPISIEAESQQQIELLAYLLGCRLEDREGAAPGRLPEAAPSS